MNKINLLPQIYGYTENMELQAKKMFVDQVQDTPATTLSAHIIRLRGTSLKRM